MPARWQYNKLSVTDRARALGCLDAGMGSREVVGRFQTSHQTINRIRQRYRQTGLFKDRPHSGRPKFTTRAEDRYVTNIVARNHFVTGPETRRQPYVLGVREPDLYQFRPCGILFMQVVPSQECLQKSQNSASATRMLVWPSAVPM